MMGLGPQICTSLKVQLEHKTAKPELLSAHSFAALEKICLRMYRRLPIEQRIPDRKTAMKAIFDDETVGDPTLLADPSPEDAEMTGTAAAPCCE